MLNNNNFQLGINNFWEMVSDMNEIHMELWNNRNDSQLKPEPDAGTLEILANCDAIEEAIENQNQIEAENQLQAELQAEIDQAKSDIISRITDMIELVDVKDITMLVKNEMLNPGSLDAYLAEKAGHIIPQDASVNDIHYLDDMDEIDRRNVNRIVEARIEEPSHSRSKRVICVTTGMAFDSIKAAAEYYGMKSANGISKCCNGKAKSAGKLNGQKLVWKFA